MINFAFYSCQHLYIHIYIYTFFFSQRSMSTYSNARYPSILNIILIDNLINFNNRYIKNVYEKEYILESV